MELCPEAPSHAFDKFGRFELRFLPCRLQQVLPNLGREFAGGFRAPLPGEEPFHARGVKILPI